MDGFIWEYEQGDQIIIIETDGDGEFWIQVNQYEGNDIEISSHINVSKDALKDMLSSLNNHLGLESKPTE